MGCAGDPVGDEQSPVSVTVTAPNEPEMVLPGWPGPPVLESRVAALGAVMDRVPVVTERVTVVGGALEAPAAGPARACGAADAAVVVSSAAPRAAVAPRTRNNDLRMVPPRETGWGRLSRIEWLAAG